MRRWLSWLLATIAGSATAAGIYRACNVLYFKALRVGALAKGRALFPHAHDLAMDVRSDVKYPENVRLGSHVIIGAYCQIGAMAPIVIGDHVRVSRGVTVETASLDLSKPLPYPHVARPIHIGRGVWLGSHCTVLGGVTIGDGAVIGAGTVVSRDVPPGAIVVGSAARLLQKTGGTKHARP